MSCDASGFPEPSFTWTKDKQELFQPQQLNIQKSDRSDTGMYVCTASNEVGQDMTAQAYVTVQCKLVSHHVMKLYLLLRTLAINEAAKELIFCRTVNCIAQSYDVP